MQIVQLSRDNVAYATQIAKELHAIGVFGREGPEFDWAYSLGAFTDIIDDPRFYARYAVDDDGLYVGAVVGHVEPFWFAPKLMAIEDGWYVREGTPSRAKIAMKLMRGFIDWAYGHKDCWLVQTGDIAAANSYAVDTLYRHMGFTRFGTMYRYMRDGSDVVSKRSA